MSQFPIASGRRIVAAVFVGTFLATVPLQVVHAEQGAKSTQTMMDHGKRATERTETRISELHAKLNITPAQEIAVEHRRSDHAGQHDGTPHHHDRSLDPAEQDDGGR